MYMYKQDLVYKPYKGWTVFKPNKLKKWQNQRVLMILCLRYPNFIYIYIYNQVPLIARIFND